MLIQNIKKAFIISFVGIVLGIIQMYWFLPDGLSCIDAKSGIIDAIFTFMSIQFLSVFLIYLITKGNTRFYSLILFLCLFWFYVNKNEFTHRRACWSTYTASEVLYNTFIQSLLPIITCITVFIFGNLLLVKIIKPNR